MVTCQTMRASSPPRRSTIPNIMVFLTILLINQATKSLQKQFWRGVKMQSNYYSYLFHQLYRFRNKFIYKKIDRDIFSTSNEYFNNYSEKCYALLVIEISLFEYDEIYPVESGIFLCRTKIINFSSCNCHFYQFCSFIFWYVWLLGLGKQKKGKKCQFKWYQLNLLFKLQWFLLSLLVVGQG